MLLIAVITLSDSDAINTTNASLLRNYVTPSKTIACSVDQDPCLTLQEYASQPDVYFTNNTIFYFEPGSHTLNNNLTLENLHNFTFQGVPDCEVLFGTLVSITWRSCSNIKVSSINLSLRGNFTFSITFECSYLVQISNISVSGNGYIGCSSIVSKDSIVYIRDSKFVGIRGSVGAALMILESCITFAHLPASGMYCALHIQLQLLRQHYHDVTARIAIIHMQGVAGNYTVHILSVLAVFMFVYALLAEAVRSSGY